MSNRESYCRRVSRELRQLQKLYARNARSRDNTPESYRQRMDLGSRIHELLATVTLEEQRNYDIW